MTPESVVAILNDLFKADPEAITSLVNHRVSCNAALADHDRCTVLTTPTNRYEVGMVGVINGLLMDDTSTARIAAEYDDRGTLVRFVTLNIAQHRLETV